MKPRNYIVILLIVLSFSANAEVFKCKDAAGKIIYQPDPCSPGATVQGVIKVEEMTAEEAEAAKAKFNAWQEQQAIGAAANREAEKERQAQLEKQERLELQRRSVIAQEQQMISEQRQQEYNRPIVIPAYDFNRYYRNNGMQAPYGGWGSFQYPRHQSRDGWQADQPNRFPSYQPYKEPPPPPYRASSIPRRTNPQSVTPWPGVFGYQR